MSGKEIIEKVEELIEGNDEKLEEYAKQNPNHIRAYIEHQGLISRMSVLKVEKCVLVLTYLLSQK